MPAQTNLLRAIDELNLDARVSIQVISSPEEAARALFAGSPSFIVEGKDLFPTPNLADHTACRIYIESGKPQGFPSVESLKEKLSQARR
jgi:hypothetical protein